MDWSCGLGTLATRWSTPFQLGLGPIKSIDQVIFSGVRHLYVLSGEKVFDSIATEINGPEDFTEIHDFSPPSVIPPAPTATLTGGPGTQRLLYRLVWSSPSNFYLLPNPYPPYSAAGPVLDVTNAPTTLDATHTVNLTWSLATQPAGMLTTLYRSADGGVTWKNIGIVGNTYTDNGNLDGWSNYYWRDAVPPPVAVGQGAYQLLGAPFDGRPYLWVGMDYGEFWRWDGTTWTPAATHLEGRALAEEGYNFFHSSTVSNATSPVFMNNNFVYRTRQDPLAGGMVGTGATHVPVYQDERSSPVTRIVSLNGTVFTFTETRIAVGQYQAEVADLTPDRSLPRHPNNGTCAVVWKGDVYTPYGMGLYRIHPTGPTSATVEAVGVERLIENSSPVQGRVVALAPWGPWHLWWAMHDERAGVGGTTYVGKYGAWLNPSAAKDPESQTVPVIHGALEKWEGRRATWMQHSLAGEPSGNGRLYLGFADGGLCYTVLPAQGPFAPTDPNCRFRSSGYTVLSRHSAGFQADNKSFFDVTAYGTFLSNNQRVRFEYKLPDDTEWRALPGEVSENGEPLVFPEGATDKWIQLRVTLETDDPADTPIVEGFALGEQVHPSSIEEISFTAHVGPRLIRRDGHVTRASAKDLHDLLRRLEVKGDDVKVMLPDGEEQRAAIIDFTDRYLEGGTTMGPRHDMSLTLLTFRTAS